MKNAWEERERWKKEEEEGGDLNDDKPFTSFLETLLEVFSAVVS